MRVSLISSILATLALNTSITVLAAPVPTPIFHIQAVQLAPQGTTDSAVVTPRGTTIECHTDPCPINHHW
ncbi:hypothetical protein QR685DRAFT_535368 [Neurospora intermedia]|uniref:Uncharacterized protein n=1 Tax=Neurospora intermedia TaxID=5142 RepID=A0ABR3D1J3_NEUIN